MVRPGSLSPVAMSLQTPRKPADYSVPAMLQEGASKKKDPTFRDRVRSYGRWYLKPDSYASLYDRSVLKEIDEDEELRAMFSINNQKAMKK